MWLFHKGGPSGEWTDRSNPNHEELILGIVTDI